MTAQRELKLLAAIVRRMPLRTRQVLTLRMVYGFSQHDIAARLRLPVPTVQRHLAQAARALAAGLDQPDEDEATAVLTLWRLKRLQ